MREWFDEHRLFLKLFLLYCLLPLVLFATIYSVISEYGIQLFDIGARTKTRIQAYIVLIYGVVYAPYSLWKVKKKSRVSIISIVGIFLWIPYILLLILINFLGGLSTALSIVDDIENTPLYALAGPAIIVIVVLASIARQYMEKAND